MIDSLIMSQRKTSGSRILSCVTCLAEVASTESDKSRLIIATPQSRRKNTDFQNKELSQLEQSETCLILTVILTTKKSVSENIN